MSRRRAPSGPTISLFPFLAVLLCTMGALLVLLVLFSRSAGQADAAAEAEATRQQAEELELARDELAWRIDQLQGVRSRTADDLAKARMQLAGIEEHARALVDEFKQLERTAAALAAPAEEDAAEPIADLEQRLAAARAALEAAREGAADRPPAYAVVPYEGSGGTHRRPLYIECCIDGVFLQPEGIRLGPGDFEGPPGPGNPLASGLRAAREYLANRPGESGQPDAQPYPLLLVRPSGVMAYYAARESLQSWGSDFGYQFIDEDWTLAFPPADPALADVEQRAVDEARRRLEWLAQARPQKRTRPAVQYRASSVRGGVVSSEGPSVLGDQSRFDWSEQQAAAAGRGFRAGGDGGSSQGDAVLGNGNGNGNGSGGRGIAGGTGGEFGGGPGGGLGGEPGGRYRGPSKFYGGSGQGGADAEAAGSMGNGSGGLPAGEGMARGGGESAGGTTAGEDVAEPGSLAGDGAGTGPAGVGGEAATGASDLAGGSGSSGGAGAAGGAGTAGGGSSAGATGAGGGGSFGPALPGMAEGQAGGSAQASADGSCSPLAGGRGSNWASLATSDRPIPLTRPLRLECSADEFRLLGSGGRVTARVPIPTRTADAVDPLVREVHAAVGGWGMAGDRMYWKPQLVLTATPDGVGRRDELERLLADSGLDTRRADDGDAVRNLPPVHRTGGVFRSR